MCLMRMVGLLMALLVLGCAAKQPPQGEVVKSIKFQGNGGFLGGVPDSSLRNAMEQSQSAGMWWMQPSERAVVLDRTSLSKDAWRIETSCSPEA